MLERISGSLLDPDALYVSNAELFHSPALRGLNLVMGFTGFADAGHVVKQITAELLDTLDSEMVAVFDADQLIDYRSRRPHVTLRRRPPPGLPGPEAWPSTGWSTGWGVRSSSWPGSNPTCSGSGSPAPSSGSSSTWTSTW